VRVNTGKRAGYRRILLKLSGEALAGGAGHGIDPSVCRTVADEIAAAHQRGVEIGVVIGGGNIMRGASTEGIGRVAADTMGMLATVINSLALTSFLEKAGCAARVLTAVAIEGAGERFTDAKARACLDDGEVVIIAGGTGNPFFTTDTAAALRCAEIGAEALLKATKVDGVYDRDPVKHPGAVRFERITHEEALSRRLRVMDATAFSFCMEHRIPIVVFKLAQTGNLLKCIEGRKVGTLVTTGGSP
jgi:uridylate kinase